MQESRHTSAPQIARIKLAAHLADFKQNFRPRSGKVPCQVPYIGGAEVTGRIPRDLGYRTSHIARLQVLESIVIGGIREWLRRRPWTQCRIKRGLSTEASE